MSRRFFIICGSFSLLMSFSATEAQVIYDFSVQSGTSHRAFKEDVVQASVPAVNDVPTTDFDSPDYDAIGFSDSVRQTSVPGVSAHAATRFVFTLSEPRTPMSMKVLWQGRTQSGGAASLYLWDLTTASYKHIDDTTSSASDVILSATTTTPANYVDPDQRVTVLIYNSVAGKSVSTNYVRLGISQCATDDDCDDQNPCTDDMCLSSVCNYTANSAPCDDGNACTVGDVCFDGTCQSGASADCSAAGKQCNSAVCDRGGAEGNCDVQIPFENGTPCDDADPCSFGDICLAGECFGGGTVDCSGLGDACNPAFCDPAGANANCDLRKLAVDGTSCDDGLFCTAFDECASGICVGSGNSCGKNEFCNENTDACDQCQFDADCDDGNPCTLGEACVAGECQPGREYECTAFDEQCLKASCDPAGARGNCDDRVLVVNGTPCDDGLFCTSGNACIEGKCEGEPVNCSKLTDSCNVGVCDETSQSCVAQPIEDGSSCDDELFCTIEDACLSGKCDGKPRDCSEAADQCNKGACDEKSSQCVPQAVVDGKACDDGDACTSNDQCQSGKCSGAVLYGLAEWSNLANCLAGPDKEASDGCACSDYSGDGRVDLLDVAKFMLQFVP
ncbi:MAG: hypothetical protein HY287_02090 [Planctomycetes bacterium]|nr:hypothetical protein [Planctomycetota bacterium]MBI3833101.1 hypothetical protein [Planctomycetota bacterium]